MGIGDKISNKAEELKGKVKEAAGQATGQTEGAAECLGVQPQQPTHRRRRAEAAHRRRAVEAVLVVARRDGIGSPAPTQKMRECSRKLPTTDFTLMFSENPGIPGLRQQMPRTISSIFTPFWLAL